MPNWCSNSLIISQTDDSKEAEKQLIKFVSDVKTEGDCMGIKDAEMYRELYIQEIFDQKYRDNATLYVSHLEMPIKQFMIQVGFIFDTEAKKFSTGDILFEMQNIYPVPAELIDSRLDSHGGKDSKEKDNIRLQMKKKYGYESSYDWRIANWGTKWDFCDTYFEDSGSQVSYTFESAWSPPTDFLMNICEKYPLLNFSLSYVEPGCAFEGELEIVAGEITVDETRDYVHKNCCTCGEDCEDGEELNDNGECPSCSEGNNDN